MHRPSFAPSLLLFALWLVLLPAIGTVDRILALGQRHVPSTGSPHEVLLPLELGSFVLPLLATGRLMNASGPMKVAFAGWAVSALALACRDPETLRAVALPVGAVGIFAALWATMAAFADGAERCARHDLAESVRTATAALFVIPALGTAVVMPFAVGSRLVNVVLMIPVWLGVVWAVQALWKLRGLDDAPPAPAPSPIL